MSMLGSGMIIGGLALFFYLKQLSSGVPPAA